MVAIAHRRKNQAQRRWQVESSGRQLSDGGLQVGNRGQPGPPRWRCQARRLPGRKGHKRGTIGLGRRKRAERPIVQVVVAGACRNRTYRGSSEPQLVLKTSRTTRPEPPPLGFSAVASLTVPLLYP